MENIKIVDYVIISNCNIEVLCADVLKKLDEGYILVGGASNGGEYNYHSQTLIKYED